MSAAEYSTTGIPVISKGDINRSGKIDVPFDKFIDLNIVRRKGYSFTSEGEIIVSTRDLTQSANNLGILGKVPAGGPYIVNQGANRLKLSDEIDHQYFIYWSQGSFFRNYIKSCAIGSTQIHLRKEDFLSAPIVFPPLPIQRQIAAALSAFDHKIELNHRMNRTLKQMARALFKSWFVDFDAVRARMRGEQPEGLDAETAALFPNSLVEANGKEVPEGWGWTTIESMCVYLSRGITPRYSELEGIKVVNQKCIRNSQIDFSKARRHDLSKSVPTEKLIQIGDVLVNSTGVGTLGRLAQVLRIEEATTVDTHVTIVRPDESKVSLVFFGIQLDLSQAEIETLGTGSTGQTELSRSVLGSYEFLLPNFDLMMAFEALVRPMRSIITELQFESNHLAQLRDALLPQLLIGKVDLMQWGIK